MRLFFNDHNIQIDERQNFFNSKIAKEKILFKSRLQRSKLTPIMFDSVDGIVDLREPHTFSVLPENRKSAESVYESLKIQLDILCETAKFSNIDPAFQVYIELNHANYVSGFDSFNPIKADSDSLLLKAMLPMVKSQSDSVFMATAVIVSSQDRLFSQYQDWVEFRTRFQSAKLSPDDRNRIKNQSEEIVRLNARHENVATHEAKQALKSQITKIDKASTDSDQILVETNDTSGNFLKEIAKNGIDLVKEESHSIAAEIKSESKKAAREAIKSYIKEGSTRLKDKITSDNRYIIEIFEWMKDLI